MSETTDHDLARGQIIGNADAVVAALRQLRRWDEAEDKCNCCSSDDWAGYDDQQDEIANKGRHHGPGCEVGALLAFLPDQPRAR